MSLGRVKQKGEPIVDIIAPSGFVSKKELNNSLVFLKKLGFKPRFQGKLFKSSFFAQGVKEAFENTVKAFYSKDSSFVWTLRGGYGSQRLLEPLYKLKRKPPFQKLFIGYSDVTVVHDFIHQKFSWPTLHFPVLTQMENCSLSSIKKFQNLIFKKQDEYVLQGLKLLNQKKFSVLKAPLTGGNLTMIQSSIGTPWSVQRKNQFLFLEDVNEEPYQLHRVLQQMKYAGIFKNVRALIFGKWVHQSKEITEQVIKPFSEEYSFPVFSGLACGHGFVSDPLPLGSLAKIYRKDSKICLQTDVSFLREIKLCR